MKKFLKRVFSKESGVKSDAKSQTASRNVENGMFRTIERVDKQIGRAVERLSER